MKLCAICSRSKPVWGWFNPHKPRDQREILWACARPAPCVDYLMSRVEGEIGIEDIAAIERSLPDVGAYVASVGMDKPLSAYSKDEVLGLIRASVAAYQGHMQALTLEELTGAGEVPW